MSEVATLTFSIYRDPQGEPTCCADARAGMMCQFLGARAFGTRPECRYPDVGSIRPADSGFFRPGSRCPLWAQKPGGGA